MEQHPDDYEIHHGYDPIPHPRLLFLVGFGVATVACVVAWIAVGDRIVEFMKTMAAW